MSINQRLLSARETAEYLGISVQTIYNGTCRNPARPFPIKAKRIFGGNALRFDIRDLEEFIQGL